MATLLILKMRGSLAILLASLVLVSAAPAQLAMLLDGADVRAGLVISCIGRVRVDEGEIEYLEVFRCASSGPTVLSLGGVSVFANRALAGVVPAGVELRRGEALLLVFRDADRRRLSDLVGAPCVACIAGVGQRIVAANAFVEVRTSRGARIDALAWGIRGAECGDETKVSRVPATETAGVEGAESWRLMRRCLGAKPTVGADLWEGRSDQPLRRPRGLSARGMLQGYVVSDEGKPIAGASIAWIGQGRVAKSEYDGSFVLPGVSVGKVELRAEAAGHAGAVWSGGFDASSPLLVHLELPSTALDTVVHATIGADGGTLRDPKGRWRVDVPSGAVRAATRFRVRQPSTFLRMEQDWGEGDTASALRTFLAGIEVEVEDEAQLASPVRVWLASDPEDAKAPERGDVFFEVSAQSGGPGKVYAGSWSADGGVTADVVTLGFVAACHEPKASDGSTLVVRNLGITMDANWDGAIDLLDSPATYANVGPGDRAMIQGTIDYSMKLDVARARHGSAEEALLARIVRSRVVHLSSLGCGGRLGGNRWLDGYPYRLECDGDWLGGRKNEVGAFTSFRIVKVSRRAPTEPHDEGEALGIVLVPIGVGGVITKTG